MDLFNFVFCDPIYIAVCLTVVEFVWFTHILSRGFTKVLHTNVHELFTFGVWTFLTIGLWIYIATFQWWRNAEWL